MNFIRRYLIVIVAGVSLLLGIQIPNFLDQYEKRIDAHLREVARSLDNYQKIATKHHAGSLHSLIAFHKTNSIETFKAEGLAIEEMFNRKLRFEMDKELMKTGLLLNVVNVVTYGNKELLQETLDHYSYAVPLNQDAIVSGVSVAMLMTFLIEAIFSLFKMLIRNTIGKRNKKSFTTA
jgi:hypothetical protein